VKIAVFGKPAGGKSTLSREIARIAGLPLYHLDLIQFAEGGGRVPDEIFLRRHSQLLADDSWVIDGFGTPQAFEDTLRAADVLVYVHRAAIVHYWRVTKKFMRSPFAKAIGWPAGSPMVRSTLTSYRILRQSHRFWTPEFQARLLALRQSKRVYVVRSQSDARSVVDELRPHAGIVR